MLQSELEMIPPPTTARSCPPLRVDRPCWHGTSAARCSPAGSRAAVWPAAGHPRRNSADRSRIHCGSMDCLFHEFYKIGLSDLERPFQRLTLSCCGPATVTVARFRVGRFLRGRAKFPTGGDGSGLSPRSPRKLHHAPARSRELREPTVTVRMREGGTSPATPVGDDNPCIQEMHRPSGRRRLCLTTSAG